MAIIERTGCKPEEFNTICASLDKLDKEPWEKVSEELREKGLIREQIDKIEEFINLKDEGFD